MAEPKWYIGSTYAEEDSSFVVQLTDEEYEGVRKFAAAQNDVVRGGGYCGSFSIYPHGFNSYEKARAFALDNHV